jgi:hypothetical protein
MMRTVSVVLIGILLAAGMAMGGPSFARAETDGFGGLEIVSAEGLDAMRGGYKAGTDLMFSFGIEKAVYVNGVLEATSSLNLLQPDGGSSQLLQGPSFKLYQSGSIIPNSNGVDLSAFTGPGQGFQGTIIQNHLDGQTIMNVTRISVGLNVLGAYRENNLSAILSQQMIRSLR